MALPTLTPDEISERDHQEFLFRQALVSCWRGDDFDSERAHKFLLSYTVELFKTIYAIYQKKPRFREKWFSEIQRETLYRSLTVFDAHLPRSVSANKFEPSARQAIREYRRDYISKSKENNNSVSLSLAIAPQLNAFKKESRLSAQKIADGIEVDLRTVQRHLAGDAVPRESHIAAYENFFTEKLRRSIVIKTP